MALQAYVGSEDLTNSVGTQATTGPGFTPNLLIGFGSFRATVDSITAADYFTFGAATGEDGVETGSFGYGHNNGDASNASGRRHSDRSWCIPQTGGIQWEFDVDSFDGSGFTIDKTTVHGTQNCRFGYLALNVDDAFVDQITTPTSTGTQAFSGWGFQPDAVIALLNYSTAYNSTTWTGDTAWCLGIGDTSSERCTAGAYDDVSSTSDAHRAWATTLYALYTRDGTARVIANIDSLDADGCTLDFTTVHTSGLVGTLIGIKHSGIKVLPYAISSSTGSQAETGAGFQAGAMCDILSAQTTVANSDANERISVGFAVSSTEEICAGGVNVDNVSTSSSDQIVNTDGMQVILGSAPAELDVSDFTSFDSDGFTINRGVASGSAFLASALLLGDLATVPIFDHNYRTRRA